MNDRVLSYVTLPHSREMTTLAAVKEEINLGADTSSDAYITRLIGQATDEIEDLIGWKVARAQVDETFVGSGGLRIRLTRRPVAALVSVEFDGSAVALANVGTISRDRGELVLESGWTKTDSPLWTIRYWGGWLMPGDDLADAAFTAAAADDSFNDPSDRFPILQAGEWVTAGDGWDAANQGSHRVVTSTAGKVTTESTLSDDSGAEVRSLAFRTLPGQLERACLQLVKILFHDRDKHPGIVSQEIDGVSESFDVEAAREAVAKLVAPFVVRSQGMASADLVRA